MMAQPQYWGLIFLLTERGGVLGIACRYLKLNPFAG
jgi:hypothetical protein